MPNLARLVANRMAATVDLSKLGAENIHIEYYLARVTTEMVLEAATLDNVAEVATEAVTAAMQRLPDTLAQLLHSWDLTETAVDGSEQPLPLDREHIAGLGYLLQMALFRTILTAKGEVSAAEATPVSAPSSAAS